MKHSEYIQIVYEQFQYRAVSPVLLACLAITGTMADALTRVILPQRQEHWRHFLLSEPLQKK
jgi:hypothetical protein